MSQRYGSQKARERMAIKMCPECGAPPSTHSNDTRFWMPRKCDLTATGVVDRIEQFERDASLEGKCSVVNSSTGVPCVLDDGHAGEHLAIDGASAYHWRKAGA